MSRSSFLPFVLVGSLFLTACGKRGPAERPAPPPREITVAEPLRSEGVDWDEYTGRVEAIENVEIRTRVDGYLTDVSFSEGDLVKKGDLLFVIDPRPYEAEVRKSAAELERAKAQVSLSEQEYERAESLRKSRAIATSDYDAKVTAFHQAKAQVESSRAALDLAKLNLEFCHIKSPIDGRVGQRRVTQGNLVESGKEILTTLVSQDPMYVYFDADENALLRYQKVSASWSIESEGTVPVELELADETGFPHKGKLDFIDNRVDPGTGTIRLRGVFDNKSGRLTPGLFARVRVPGGEAYEAFLVPDAAIGTDQGNRFVLVVGEGDVVEYRSVTLGPLRNGLRVIRTGLSAGEKIATTGLQLISSGDKIIPKLTSLTPGATAPKAPAPPAPPATASTKE